MNIGVHKYFFNVACFFQFKEYGSFSLVNVRKESCWSNIWIALRRLLSDGDHIGLLRKFYLILIEGLIQKNVGCEMMIFKIPNQIRLVSELDDCWFPTKLKSLFGEKISRLSWVWFGAVGINLFGDRIDHLQVTLSQFSLVFLDTQNFWVSLSVNFWYCVVSLVNFAI